MVDRFVKPQTVRLTISDGDFIDVKLRLNTGEQQDLFARITPHLTPGAPVQLQSRQVMTAKVLAYLVGWSLTDDGRPVPMSPDLSDEVRQSTLNNLDPDTFREIRAAIDAHEAATDKLVEQLRKNPNGAAEWKAPSTSVAP